MGRFLLILTAGLAGLACTTPNPAPPLPDGAGNGRVDALVDGAGPTVDGATCPAKTFYRDADSDGFGTSASKVQACVQPPGHVASSLDCDDLDPAAHPGQTAYFNVPSKGSGRFDYDCDSLEEKEATTVVSCTVSGMGCIGDGWLGAVPACGTTGVWARCTKQGAGRTGCGTTTSNKIQSCH